MGFLFEETTLFKKIYIRKSNYKINKPIKANVSYRIVLVRSVLLRYLLNMNFNEPL